MNRERLHGLIDLVLDMGQSLRPHAPKEAMGHFREARREGLLGVKALVDHALERRRAEESGAQGEEPKAIPLD